MLENPHSLAGVQRWMQAVMTHPDGLDAGAESASLQSESTWQISDIIERSQQQSSHERLAIYAHAYSARLLEVMSSEFPTLQYALGDELFHDFAMGYLAEYPSTSYTLSELGRSFPEFLAASRPERATAEPDWADLFVDIAQLERTYSEVFDGPGMEAEPPFDISMLQTLSAEEWTASRLTPAPCLRLLQLQFPVHEYVTAFRKEQSPEIPAPRPTHLVISRRDFIVRRADVPLQEFKVLEALFQGATIGEALQVAVENEAESSDDDLPARIRAWFQDWFRAQYFAGIQRPDQLGASAAAFISP